MIKDTDLIQVRNRNHGSTGYTLDEGKLHREFSLNETKKVPFAELKQLQYAPGGEYILNNYLVIENKEALDLLNMAVEPEYFYDETNIRKVLFEGSIDAFADFLDFAPKGAIEIAKDMAIKEEIPDVRKRDMLSKKTGLNITSAIMVNQVMDEEEEKVEEETPKRRVPVGEKEKEEPTVKERRTEVPAPKIIVKK